MNSLIVDTNVLVYIYSGTPNIGRRYAELLGDLSAKYNLVIPKLVYGELSLIFNDSKQLNSFLNDTGIIIGAYALQTEEQKIVTSDKGYYGSYFPELTIITADL